MAVSVWQDRSHRREEHADVAVLGAGFRGAACAWWLAREGLGVVVVDRAAPGAGAAGRGLGVLWSGPPAPVGDVAERWGPGRALAAARACREGVRLLAGGPLADRDHQVGLGEPGAAWLATDPQAAAGLVRSAELLAAGGLPGSALDAEALSALAGASLPAPAQAFAALSQGLWDPEALALDPLALVELLLEQAMGSGARVLPHEEIFAVETGPRGVEILTQGTTLRAEAVVSCLGGDHGALFPGSAPPLEAVARWGALLPDRGAAPLPWPARLWPSGVGLRPLGSGELLCAGEGAVVAGAPGAAVEIGAHGVARAWRDRITAAPDGLALAGGSPERRRFFLLGGADAQWGFAFAAARQVAIWLTQGRAPEGIFRAGREA